MTQESKESYADRVERVRAERIAQLKKQQRASRVRAGVLFVGALVLISLLFLFSAWIFAAVTWNIGVVGLATACGASVGKISLLTGLGAVSVIMTLKELLHGKPVAQLLEERRAAR